MRPQHIEKKAITLASPIAILIPASGVGSRFGKTIPKQYYEINQKPILLHTLETLKGFFPDAPFFLGIDLKNPNIPKIQTSSQLIQGGETRGETVLLLLEHTQKILPLHAWILIHDAARPFVSIKILNRLMLKLQSIELSKKSSGVVAALPLVDALRMQDADGFLAPSPLHRSLALRIQTPQVFRLGELLEALKKNPLAQDESEVMVNEGHQVTWILGEEKNFKITTFEDLKRVPCIPNPKKND